MATLETLYKMHFEARNDAMASHTVNGLPSLVQRDTASTCGPSGTSNCDKPEDASNTSTIIVAVAVAVPVSVALALLWFLHRRIKKKMRREDNEDKHASLDFGLDEVPAGARAQKTRKVKREMSANGFNRSRGRNLSLGDMDIANPYLLPTAVANSRESLNTMSRYMSNDIDDPYRPVTFISKDRYSTRSPTKFRHDSDVSPPSYKEKPADAYQAGLLHNAAQMAHDSPFLDSSRRNSYDDQGDLLPPPPPPPRKSSAKDAWYPADDQIYGLPSSPQSLYANSPQRPRDYTNEPPLPALPPAARQASPPRTEEEPQPYFPGTTHASKPRSAAALHITIPSPTHNRQSPPRSPAEPQIYVQEPAYHQSTEDQDVQIDSAPAVPNHNAHRGQLNLPGQDSRRISVMGMRPLPVEDPSDNPEQRANRIRSFYKEYFDESKPNPPGQYPAPANDPYGESAIDDDYYGGFLDDGAVYDPDTGVFYYAQPEQQEAGSVGGRSAMTPSLRGSNFVPRPRRRSVMSSQSAARRLPPKKKLPPPKPLISIPTPHLIKNDSGGYNEFAPRLTFRERQNGRTPDSPRGVSRPYSPAFSAHTPIARSFDDLAIMPSPHALRKSGTFTSLDFAPPPRFRERAESASETGSIRSNRSGLSAVQANAIRQGAYRLSRVPADQVGTKMDLAQSLKPKWDLGR